MKTEPIRLPSWLAAFLGVVVIPPVIAILTGTDWKAAVAGALAAVVPMLGAGELARSRAWSPAAHDNAVAGAAVTAAVDARLDTIDDLEALAAAQDDGSKPKPKMPPKRASKTPAKKRR